jgi:dimethylhistidine N-methyltransferase
MTHSTSEFLVDALAGLSRSQKTLPCKYLYDQRGSELFDRICDLPEYYHTRTEMALLQSHATEMVARFGPSPVIIEYGSGSSRKTRLLLDAITQGAYLPVDISGEHLRRSACAIRRDYPHLEVMPILGDFTKPLQMPDVRTRGKRVVYFSGSTISNFAPPQAAELLRNIAAVVGSGGGLLLGVDRQKDKSIIEPAYDDAAGVTAAFNRNLLVRLNRELGGTFDLEQFTHRAPYDEVLGRIEMQLVSQRDQQARLGDEVFAFAANEVITTEYSYKFNPDQLRRLLQQANMRIRRVWSDEQEWFSVLYAEVA